MRSTGHAAIGAVAGFALGVAAPHLPMGAVFVPDPPTAALVGALGAVLPDSDSPGGWLRVFGWRGRSIAERIRWLTYPPARRPGFAQLPPERKGHRGLLHSAIAVLVALLLPCGVVAATGYLTHLLVDAADARGVPLGAPFTWRRYYLRPTWRRRFRWHARQQMRAARHG